MKKITVLMPQYAETPPNRSMLRKGLNRTVAYALRYLAAWPEKINAWVEEVNALAIEMNSLLDTAGTTRDDMEALKADVVAKVSTLDARLLAHLNVSAWQPGTYAPPSVVIGSDGGMYRALQSTAVDPVGDTTSAWIQIDKRPYKIVNSSVSLQSGWDYWVKASESLILHFPSAASPGDDFSVWEFGCRFEQQNVTIAGKYDGDPGGILLNQSGRQGLFFKYFNDDIGWRLKSF